MQDRSEFVWLESELSSAIAELSVCGSVSESDMFSDSCIDGVSEMFASLVQSDSSYNLIVETSESEVMSDSSLDVCEVSDSVVSDVRSDSSLVDNSWSRLFCLIFFCGELVAG